jgi:hypothetical protein
MVVDLYALLRNGSEGKQSSRSCISVAIPYLHSALYRPTGKRHADARKLSFPHIVNAADGRVRAILHDASFRHTVILSQPKQRSARSEQK